MRTWLRPAALIAFQSSSVIHSSKCFCSTYDAQPLSEYRPAVHSSMIGLGKGR